MALPPTDERVSGSTICGHFAFLTTTKNFNITNAEYSKRANLIVLLLHSSNRDPEISNILFNQVKLTIFLKC